GDPRHHHLRSPQEGRSARHHLAHRLLPAPRDRRPHGRGAPRAPRHPGGRSDRGRALGAEEAMKLSELLSLPLLEEMVAEGYVTRRWHRDYDLAILNYT